MRGFTLIETVLYIALFGLIMSGGFAGIFAISESIARNQASAYLQYEGEYLLSSMSYSIQNAESMEEPEQDEKSTLLSLASNTGSIEFMLSDGVLEESVGTQGPLGLSGNAFTVSGLSFVRSSASGLHDTDSMRTTFTLSTHTSQGQVVSEYFSDSFSPAL